MFFVLLGDADFKASIEYCKSCAVMWKVVILENVQPETQCCAAAGDPAPTDATPVKPIRFVRAPDPSAAGVRDVHIVSDYRRSVIADVDRISVGSGAQEGRVVKFSDGSALE